MRAKLVTLLLVAVLSMAMVALGNAAEIGTLSHVGPVDNSKQVDLAKQGDQGKNLDHGKQDDHGKSGDFGKPDDSDKSNDRGKPWDHAKPDDGWRNHGTGTVVVTVLGKNGRPATESSVSMDGRFVGITNHQGMLTIRNVNSGAHTINANKNARYSNFHGTTQIWVQRGQTTSVNLQLRHWGRK
jgi:hypothetical protein